MKSMKNFFSLIANINVDIIPGNIFALVDVMVYGDAAAEKVNEALTVCEGRLVDKNIYQFSDGRCFIFFN